MMKARVPVAVTMGLLFLTVGCVRPLGPGFAFIDRSTDIRSSSETPGRLHVRVADRLENAGDRPLRTIAVQLPVGSGTQSQDLRVAINGSEVRPEQIPGGGERLRGIPIDPTWKQMESRQIVTEWDVTPAPAAPGNPAASGVAFYMAEATILPQWQPPLAVFPKADARPPKETLTIFAPGDLRVYAPGKLLGQRKQGNVTAHRYKINSSKDPWPFVVAGRYQERIVRVSDDRVTFWTFEPLDAQQAQSAATRLAESYRALNDFFGAVLRDMGAIHIAEAPAEVPAELPEVGGVSFPGGVLLDARAFAKGISSESVLEVCEYELARTWFVWRISPRAEAQMLLGRGAAWFGLVVAAEGRGSEDRRKAIALLLNRYDEVQHVAPDLPLLGSAAEPTDAQRVTMGYKSALMFVALEDLCGRKNLSAAFREMIQARAGSDAEERDFRAAIEDASGSNLAEFFREWETQPGIPRDFRARYGNPSNAAHID